MVSALAVSIKPSRTGTTNTTYAYDANGNMLTGNGRTATWTSFNKVASMTRGTNTVSFDYDSEHGRIRQVTGSNTTLYINDPASGLRVEKVTGATGSVQWNDYLFAGGRMVAQHYNVTTGGVTTTSTSYFTLDHLGSIAVIADGSGAVIERLSYDAWGKRRFPTGADDPTGSITSSTTRGFTGHEMIDDVGLVNMNGRIYDPQIGRFLSADPIVQDLTDSQALNRYAYVRNNPLSLTDPDGFSWLSNIIKAVVVIVAVVLLQYYILPALWGTTYAALTTPTLTGAAAATASTTLAINAGIAGAIGGYIATGTVKGAIVGALTAAAFYQVGNVIQDNGLRAVEAAGLRGAVGCASSAAGGGSCQSGFLAAGFSSLAGSVGNVGANDNFGGFVANTAQHAVAGGFGSVLGGGKFGNGAVTGAFGYLFNDVAHRALNGDVVIERDDGSTETRSKGSLSWRNNNPGNMRSGVKGYDSIGKNAGFAIFSDSKTGFGAMVANLKTARYQSQTVGGAIQTWAPGSDGNDPVKYAAQVSSWTGLSVSTQMNQLTAAQINDVATAIQRYEGWQPGVVAIMPPPSP